MNFKELQYTIMNKPYFVVNVLSNGRKIKTFIQLAASTVKGEVFFLIDKKLKCAWWKPFTPIIDGLKFVVYVDINNAIPLKIETETKYLDSDYIIKEFKFVSISEDEEKQKKNKKSGLPEKYVEITHPPAFLYQQVEAHYVTEILKVPSGKWESLRDVLIIAVVGGAIILYLMMNGGVGGLIPL